MDKPTYEELFKNQYSGNQLFFFWRKNDRTEPVSVNRVNYTREWYEGFINKFEGYHTIKQYPIFSE
jgi:hypothetical protein